MTVCLCLDQRLLGHFRDALAATFPSASIYLRSPGDDDGAELCDEFFEVAVMDIACLDGLTSDAIAGLADAELILVVDDPATIENAQRAARVTDFLVLGDDASPEHAAREAVIRVERAFRKAMMSTHERQQQEAITRSLQEIVYRLDEDGRFVSLNDAIGQLGHDPDDLLGRHFTELLAPGFEDLVSRERVLPAYHGRTTGPEGAPRLFDERRRGERQTRELEIGLRGGGRLRNSRFIGLVTASGDVVTTIDGRNEVIGTIGVIRDVSADARASDSIRKLFVVAESVPFGVVVTNAELIVDYANPALYRTFGLEPMEVMSRPISALPVPGFDDDLATALREAVSSATTFQKEIRVAAPVAAAGSYVLAGRPVFNERGDGTGVVLTFSGPELPTDREPEAVDTAPRAALGEILEEAFPSGGPALELTVHCGRNEYPAAVRDLIVRALRTLSDSATILARDGGQTATVECLADSIGIVLRAESGPAVTTPGEAVTRRSSDQVAGRLEIMRSEVLESGGTWTVDRADGRLEFTVVIPVEPAHEPEGFDFDRFASTYRDSPEVLREIVSIYLDEVPERLASIRAGLESGDLAPVIKAAHSLANTSGTLQNDRAVQGARALEAAARDGDRSESEGAAGELLPEIEAMLEELRARNEREQ